MRDRKKISKLIIKNNNKGISISRNIYGEFAVTNDEGYGTRPIIPKNKARSISAKKRVDKDVSKRIEREK